MIKSFASKLFIGIFLVLSLFPQKPRSFDPKVYEARKLFNQGMLYYNNCSYEAAIEKFFQSLRIRSRDNLVRYYLGMAFYKGGYTENAIEQWQNIIKLHGHDAILEQKINFIYYLWGKKARKKSSLKDYVFLKSFPDLKITNRNFMRYPTGIYVNDADNLFYLDYLKNSLSVLDGNGRYKKSIISGLTGKVKFLRTLNKPYELIPDNNNGFFISDFGNDRILHIDQAGGLLNIIGSKGLAARGTNVGLMGPEGIALDKYNNLYIADTGNCRILYVNQEGEFIYSFGSRGEEKGELLMPAGLALSPDNRKVYVCDRGNNRIQVFDTEGNYLDDFGSSYLHFPRKLLFVPQKKEAVVVLDAENVYLINENRSEYKSIFYSVGDFTFKNADPVSMVFDNTGLLYISDVSGPSIRIFSPMKLMYVNLNVQTERIYMRNFPKILVTVSVKNREGIPITGLKSKNFSIYENGIEKPVKLNRRREEYNNLRLTLLVEKSKQAQKRKNILKNIVEELSVSLKRGDKMRIFSFGGGAPKNDDTYKDVLPYNNSVLKNIDRSIRGEYFESCYVGTVLKKAIDINLKNNYKKGIVILAFTDYRKEVFLPEKFTVLCDFAAHNGIPLYIIYAGKVSRRENPYYYFKKMARITDGKFVIYKNRKSITGILQNVKTFKNGFYDLVYE
ncbi:MAG TPA: hypothetical protein VKS21_06290, partial [Spirochaetota bacterium]|nr:hypothetical protein [Spirochaetota bacterium]